MTADPSPQQHPSHLALELWAFTPDGEPRDASVGAHVERCANCASLVSSWKAQRAAFLGQHQAGPFLDTVSSATEALPPPPKRLPAPRRWPLQLALAASLLAVVGVGLKLGSTAELVHLKGEVGLSLELLVSRDGAVATPAPLGSLLARGDVLRFAVSVPGDGYIFIANVDQTGHFTRYFPPESSVSERLTKVTRFVLPGSIALDDYLGDERVVLIFSTTPLESAHIEQALSAAFQRAGLDGLEHADLPARLTSTPVHKAAR